MNPMNVLLTRVPAPKTSKADFARLFGDHDFNGTASNDDMHHFWQAALRCIQDSRADLLRIVAMSKLGSLTDVATSPHFTKLNVRIVLYQLILRLLKPERINQEQFGLCGPAHFTIMLIKTKPNTYVQMAMDLLLKGATKGDDGFDIVPDKYVLGFDPTGKIPAADWLIAGSLRNACSPIPPGKDIGEYGGTKAPDVFSFCRRAGYSEVAAVSCYESPADGLMHWIASSYYEQYHPVELRNDIRMGRKDPSDPLENIKIAAELLKQGWRVLLKVNSSWVTNNLKKDDFQKAASGNKFSQNRIEANLGDTLKLQSMFGGLINAQNANHWVFARKLEFDDEGYIKAVLATWGKSYTPGVVPLKDFVHAYSGFVAARG